MTNDELKAKILYNQHLTNKTDKRTVCHDLNGVQAQFMTNVYHALKTRCKKELPPDDFGDGLIKSWTVRGTVHVFHEDDLPLFLHESRTHYLRPVDQMVDDEYITVKRKAIFADYILELIASGIDEREALKEKCFSYGMTEQESKSIFNSWGGTIRYLAESGKISYKVQEKKAFQLCPFFTPMKEETAKLEMARRYFTNFAPATVKDAAYYFGITQAQVKAMLSQLPVSDIVLDGKTYYYIDNGVTNYPDIPDCIFLAGFDQLMLGYQKQESIFLPSEHLRGIFNLAGIVMPSILLYGRVVGKWKKKDRKLTLTLFESISGKDKKAILQQAESEWNELKKIIWE